MLKSCLFALLALAALSTLAEANGRFVYGQRSYVGPYTSAYRSRAYVNPPGPGYYYSRTVSVGHGVGYSTGPVYPVTYGYQFTPYYYPVMPVQVIPAPAYYYDYGYGYYGW